jgi:hypothetical protein
MLRFCGFELELDVDAIVWRHRDDPAVCTATDGSGRCWVIVEAAHPEGELAWICAPASRMTTDLVAAGRAPAVEAVKHSLTGWAELVRMVAGHAVPEERLPCAEVAEHIGAAFSAAVLG